MNKIIDFNDLFYKKICEKFIKATEREMLLIKDDKIIHFVIEDEYVRLKNDGKINIKNYEKYLDNDVNVYEYDTFKEFYESYVQEEIEQDFFSLPLFDEDTKKWEFYLDFEELKKLGYGSKIKGYYPLINQYIVRKEEIENFYNCFSFEQLNMFENTLYLYYETDDLTYGDDGNLISKTGQDISFDVINLSEGLMDYKEFIEDKSENYLKDNIDMDIDY